MYYYYKCGDSMKKSLMVMLMVFLLATTTANAADVPINDSLILNDIYSIHLEEIKIKPITDEWGYTQYHRIAEFQLIRQRKVVDSAKVDGTFGHPSFTLTDGTMSVTGNNVTIYAGQQLFLVVIKPLEWSFGESKSILERVVLEHHLDKYYKHLVK